MPWGSVGRFSEESGAYFNRSVSVAPQAGTANHVEALRAAAFTPNVNANVGDCGVPCVSLAGGTTASRAGASILHAANLPELVAETEDQFVAIACELARDADRLRTLRTGMRERLRISALLDHTGFARKLEAEYRKMWEAWCLG